MGAIDWMEKLGKQDQGAPEQKTVQKYQKNCTLRNIKTRYTLDTSTKVWSDLEKSSTFGFDH